MFRTLEAFSNLARRWWPALLWMLLIIAASLDWASGGHTLPVLKTILRWFNPDATMRDVYDFNILFRKTCHFLQFFILALLIWRTRGSWRFVSPRADLRFSGFVLTICGALAVGSEVIQHYVQSRSASGRDVLINLSGATAGILVSLAVEILAGRKAEPTTGCLSSRILLTADTRFDLEPLNLEEVRGAVARHKPDLFIVAGNVCNPLHAENTLKQLKQAAGSTPVAFCLGSYDHWLDPKYWTQYPSPASIREKIWRPAVLKAGVCCLDFTNFHAAGIVVTGGYGHFDLGFRDESIRVDNGRITRDDYLRGTVAGLECVDMRRIPNAAKTLQEEADLQAAGIATRLVDASRGNQPILLVTGTAARREWSGYHGESGCILNFFQAYAGNSLLGPLLQPHAKKICLAVCGSTHEPASEVVGEIHGLNVGPVQGRLRFTLIEMDAGDVRIRQEMV